MADATDDPSTESSEYRAMKPEWTLISDIMAGIEKIRLRKERYLPKYEDESRTEYDRRLKSAPWRPEFTDALRSLASKPFDKEVGLKGNVVDRVKQLAEDIDGRGNDQTAFSREMFGKGIAKGLHAILVDYPTMEPNTTKAAEQATGARPYWVQIQADDILALYTVWENGREVVSHVRIRETVLERSGFGEVKVERIRVLEPGHWELWEKRADAQTYAKIDGGDISRGRTKAASVPLVLFFTGERIGEMQVRPPLSDLAQMQIELYQSLSRQDEVLTFAGSPMLCAKGLGPPTDGSQVTVGPKSVLYAPAGAGGVQTDWAFVQPNAANIAEIRQHVQSIIDDMRRLGMQPTVQKTGRPTATGQAIEGAKAHSAVQAWALGLKDALEQAWLFTCEWMDEATNVEVQVATDFGVEPYADAPLAALDKGRARKDLSQRTYWDGLRRFDVLPPDFDADVEEETLAMELQGLEPEVEVDPITGDPLHPAQPVPPLPPTPSDPAIA